MKLFGNPYAAGMPVERASSQAEARIVGNSTQRPVWKIVLGSVVVCLVSYVIGVCVLSLASLGLQGLAVIPLFLVFGWFFAPVLFAMCLMISFSFQQIQRLPIALIVASAVAGICTTAALNLSPFSSNSKYYGGFILCVGTSSLVGLIGGFLVGSSKTDRHSGSSNTSFRRRNSG